MGSRVDARMAQVASELDGRELTTEQQAVADVFGGKADNLTISVKTRDGSERKVVMRQGNEANAGAKHSLFRHYGTNNGAITVDDILLIPEIIANGERTEKKRGNKTVIEYKHTDNNGVEYTVLTENNKEREEFANFYTNRKASPSARKTRSEEARASNGNASTDKDSNNISNLQEDTDIRYRSFGGNSGYASEEQQITDRAKADGTYMKAPNGKDTNLSPKQWVQVRTKAFKKWFGDWEAFFKKNFLLNGMPVAVLTGDELYPIAGKKLTDQVEDYFKSIGGNAVSPLFGNVILDRKGADDSLAHGMGRNKAVLMLR